MTMICIACGMPMDSDEDHARADASRPYCCYCAREDGTMQSYPEKLAGYTKWLVATQGLDPTVAENLAESILKQLPAWRVEPAS